MENIDNQKKLDSSFTENNILEEFDIGDIYSDEENNINKKLNVEKPKIEYPKKKIKEPYHKMKEKKRNLKNREKAKKNIYLQVKDMSKSEKEKFYDRFYLEQEENKKKLKTEMLKALTSDFIICFDLNYDIYMKEKEKKSLIYQLILSYSLNKRNKKKINFYFTNISDEIMDPLNKKNAFKWCVHFNKEPFYLIPNLVNLKKEFIYLSPDAEEELEEVTEDKIYIIGGLVDRQVIQNRSMIRVTNLQGLNLEIKLKAKKLALHKYLDNINNPILNINTVVEILSCYMDMENKNWKDVFEKVIPQRKIKMNSDKGK